MAGEPIIRNQSASRDGHPKVALVLGGGGAKGAAEVGVLKYLKEINVPIDMVVGTSIGSIVGGMYCSGVEVSTMDNLFRNQEWLDLFTDRRSALKGDIYYKENGIEYVFGFPVRRNTKGQLGEQKKIASSNSGQGRGVPSNGEAVQDQGKKLGLLSGDSITSLFARIVGYTKPLDFDKLPTPFRCVAVDVKTMQEVIFSKGNLPLAMRASMSLPGIFSPLTMGDRLLMDGGIVNNLPVDVARRMGADIVIAVDLSQDAELKEEPESNWWLDALGSIDLGGHLNWLVRRPDNKKYRDNLKNADLVISPDIHEYDVASFNANAVAVMIERGYTAAKKALPALSRISMKAYGLAF